MKISSTTWCDVISIYEGTDALVRHLEAFKGTPFCNFELSLGASPDPKFMWYDDSERWRGVIEQVGTYVRDNRYTLINAHSVTGDYYMEEDVKKRYRRAVRRNIEACAMLGIPNIVIHGMGLWREPGVSLERMYEVNRAFYADIAEDAERFGVDILTENYARDVAVYPFTTGRKMRDFVDWAGIPRMHLLWDTGHANMADPVSQYDDIVAMGDELRCLHIHDNWGGIDCHSIPFNGTIDFDAIIRGLRDIDYKGYFNFEASDMFIISEEQGRGRTRMNHVRGDKLADPPTSIFTAYYNLLYATGKWMLSEYNLYEE